MSALPPGIFRTKAGYRTFQWIPHPDHPKGKIVSKRWSANATLKEMAQWREAQRVEARKPRAPAEAPLAGFASDVAQYLKAVRAMRSYRDRARDMDAWLTVLGETPSLEIPSSQIRAARDAWLTVGPKRVRARVHGHTQLVERPLPLAASTVNHRLRALENFFTVMYPGRPNPVRDVPEATEPVPEPRGHSFSLALEVLSHMPDVTTPKKGELPERGSLSRVRFETMLWTGLPPVQLAGLKPQMVDWTAKMFQPPTRAKGRQSRRARHRERSKPRPLLPQAIDALRRFFALDAGRKFSTTSLERSVKRAITAANTVRATQRLPLIPAGIRLYDLTRHTFGTEAMRASGNLKAVQELMGHSDITQTERYAAAAVTEQTVLAVAEMAKRAKAARGRHLTGGKVSPRPSSGRVRSRRKSSRGNV